MGDRTGYPLDPEAEGLEEDPDGGSEEGPEEDPEEGSGGGPEGGSPEGWLDSQ